MSRTRHGRTATIGAVAVGTAVALIPFAAPASQAATASHAAGTARHAAGTARRSDIAEPWDFNGDGRADLASSNGGGEVIVQDGTKNGLSAHGIRFTGTSKGLPATPTPGSTFFGLSLASADFNHDGYADLAISDPLRQAVFVLFGSKNGLTTKGSQLLTDPTTGESYDGTIHVGDLNNDGWSDLMVQTQVPYTGPSDANQDAITVLWGASTGFDHTNSYEIPSPSPQSSNFGSGLIARNLDGDGYPDLVVTSSGTPGSDDSAPGGTWLCPGSADGPTSCTSIGGQADAVDIGNVVGNSKPDVVTADADVITVYKDTSSGLATGKTTTASSVGAGHLYGGDSLLLAPLNGGRRDDVVVGNIWAKNVSGQITILRGRVSGVTTKGAVTIDQDTKGVPGMSIPKSSKGGEGNSFGGATAAENFTGTGRMDLVVGAPDGPQRNAEQGAVYYFTDTKNGLASDPERTLRNNVKGISEGKPDEGGFGGVLN